VVLLKVRTCAQTAIPALIDDDLTVARRSGGGYGSHPLVVDIDAFFGIDVIVESVMSLVRESPRMLLHLPRWLARAAWASVRDWRMNARRGISVATRPTCWHICRTRNVRDVS